MSVSTKNTKLGNVPNLSLIPVKDCINCKYCKKDCYALKSYRQYPDVRASWKENSRLAHRNPEAFVKMVESYLAKTTKTLFRIHVAGDFFGQQYLELWIGIASRFPRIKFLAFTKSFSLDFSARPENLQIVFSMWPKMPVPENQDGIRRAWVQDGTESRIPEDAIHCSGTCESCGMCFSLDSIGRDVYFDVH